MSVAPTIGMGQTWGCTQFQQIRYGYGSHGGYGSSFKIPWRSALGQKIEALRQTKVKICIYIIHCILYIYILCIYILYIYYSPARYFQSLPRHDLYPNRSMMLILSVLSTIVDCQTKNFSNLGVHRCPQCSRSPCWPFPEELHCPGNAWQKSHQTLWWTAHGTSVTSVSLWLNSVLGCTMMYRKTRQK